MLFLFVCGRELGRRWAQLLRGEAGFSHFQGQFGPPHLRVGSEICWWKKRKWMRKVAGREKTEAARSGWGKEGLKDECWEKQAVSHPPSSSRKVGRACCAVQRSSCALRLSAMSYACFFSDPQESWHSPCLSLSFSVVIQNYPISTLSVFSLTSKHAPMHVIQGIPLSVLASTSNWGIAAFPLPKTLLLLCGNILVF